MARLSPSLRSVHLSVPSRFGPGTRRHAGPMLAPAPSRHISALPPALLSIAAGQHSAVTGRQVRAVLGERSLRHAVWLGLLVPLWRGTYAVREKGVTVGSVPTLTRLAAAELTVRRPITACLQTTAELYGFAVDDDPSTHTLGDRSTTLTGLEVHRTPPVGPLQVFRGFRIVDPAETAVRLAAAAANAPRSLAVLDAAIRSRFTTVEALIAMAAALHVDGVSTARSLITIADGRAESPPESWLRWVCHDAGLPPPEPSSGCGARTVRHTGWIWPGRCSNSGSSTTVFSSIPEPH